MEIVKKLSEAVFGTKNIAIQNILTTLSVQNSVSVPTDKRHNKDDPLAPGHEKLMAMYEEIEEVNSSYNSKRKMVKDLPNTDSRKSDLLKQIKKIDGIENGSIAYKKGDIAEYLIKAKKNIVKQSKLISEQGWEKAKNQCAEIGHGFTPEYEELQEVKKITKKPQGTKKGTGRELRNQLNTASLRATKANVCDALGDHVVKRINKRTSAEL